MSNIPLRHQPMLPQQYYRDDSAEERRWIPTAATPILSRKGMSIPMKNQDGSNFSYQTMSVIGPDVVSAPPRVRPISLLKLLFDGVSFVSVIVAWLLLKYIVKPFRRAFLCSDLDLYRPQPPQNVFPTWLLFVCAIIIPLVVIVISEGVRWVYILRTKSDRTVYKVRFFSKVIDVPQWMGNLYIIVGVFAFSNGVNSLLTNIGKVAMGRLRPHFIPSCFGKYFYKDFCQDPNEWIWNYTCIGETSSTVKEKDGAYDIRQSFPSGHASTAFCGLIFLALYIHKVWNYRNMGLLPYVAQSGCFALAAYIGITRITDNRHHPTDVLSGAVLGTVIAVIAFRYMIKSFKQATSVDLGNEPVREREDSASAY